MQQEQNKKKVNTYNRMVVTRGVRVERWGEDEESKGAEIYGDRRRLDFEW